MMKRREFLITGVCTVGALVAARSLFASPEPPAYVAAPPTAPGYHLHGSSGTGCARFPGDIDPLNALTLAAYGG